MANFHLKRWPESRQVRKQVRVSAHFRCAAFANTTPSHNRLMFVLIVDAWGETSIPAEPTPVEPLTVQEDIVPLPQPMPSPSDAVAFFFPIEPQYCQVCRTAVIEHATFPCACLGICGPCYKRESARGGIGCPLCMKEVMHMLSRIIPLNA